MKKGYKKELRKKIDYFKIYFNSRILKKKFIYVIGDSHIGFCRREESFIPLPLGPATMFNLNKKNSITQSNRKFYSYLQLIKKQDIMILVLGEIDCRNHIFKNSEKGNYEETIEKTIDNYFEILDDLNNRELKFYVLSITPVSRRENIPYKGNKKERIKITKIFNIRLEKRLKDKNYNFINLYIKTSDKKGFILNKYTNDGVHLNKKIIILIEKELISRGIKLNQYNKLNLLVRRKSSK